MFVGHYGVSFAVKRCDTALLTLVFGVPMLAVQA
jgi:hypothetical protein